jgi:uncharacterized membrane protein
VDRGATFPLLKRHWSPTTRLVTGLAGAGLAAYGMARHDLPGAIASIAGVGLGARAVTNRGLPRQIGPHYDQSTPTTTVASAA